MLRYLVLMKSTRDFIHIKYSQLIINATVFQCKVFIFIFKYTTILFTPSPIIKDHGGGKIILWLQKVKCIKGKHTMHLSSYGMVISVIRVSHTYSDSTLHCLGTRKSWDQTGAWLSRGGHSLTSLCMLHYCKTLNCWQILDWLLCELSTCVHGCTFDSNVRTLYCTA